MPNPLLIFLIPSRLLTAVIPEEIRVLSSEQETVPSENWLRVFHPLGIDCKSRLQTARLSSGPACLSESGPARQPLSWPACRPAFCPSPLLRASVLGGFLLQKAAKLTSYFSDLRSLSEATLAAPLRGPIRPAFFLLNRPIARTLESLPTTEIVSGCHLLVCFCRNLVSFVQHCPPGR